MREITDDLLKRGIIRQSVSPYCARVIPVRKKDGRMRLCVDLRPLNSRIEKQKYSFLLIEEYLSRLYGKSVYTLFDLKDGFHQIKVKEEHIKYFSFAIPDGQFKYVRLLFGYSEVPTEFQKRLIQILNPLIRSDRILVYVDDILIATKTIDENLEILEEVLKMLKKYEFEFNYAKCLFLKKSVEFLGYVISEEGISLSLRHMEAVRKFKKLLNVHQVRQFLDLVGYFRKFIRDFVKKSKPLQDLLKKESVFELDSACEEAFELLKNERPPYCGTILERRRNFTDASVLGLGTIQR